MIPTNRRAMAALLAGAAVALGLVGCSAGQLTQTAVQVPAVPGANVTVGVIGLRNLQIAYSGPDGYAAGGNAPLIVRIFNEGSKPVKLTGATARVAARAVRLPGGAAAPPRPSPHTVPPSARTASAAPCRPPPGRPTPSPSPTGSATLGGPRTPRPARRASHRDPGPVLRAAGARLRARTCSWSASHPACRRRHGGRCLVRLRRWQPGRSQPPFAPAPGPVRGSRSCPGEQRTGE